MAYQRNDTVIRLLAHTYGQKATVALPVQRTASTQTGQFPAGVRDVLTELVETYADWEPGRPIQWCFLVGGPGNGKSEALRLLAETLSVALPPRSTGDPAPRTVPIEWPSAGLAVVPGLEIALINDASIPRPESLQATGATSLYADLVDGLRRLEPDEVPAILFANVNRGILVEELAACDSGRNSSSSDMAQLAIEILRWLAKPESEHETGSGALALTVPSTPAARYYAQAVAQPRGSRSETLVIHAVFLDTLSLLEPPPGDDHSIDFSGSVPVVQPYRPLGGIDANQGTRAGTVAGERTRYWVQAPLWQGGGCTGSDGNTCAAYAQCPFAQNTEWLRQSTLAENFLSILRASEVVAGRRLTYRDLLAHIAGAVLGLPEQPWLQGVHPCQWVEEHHRAAQPADLVTLVHHRVYVNLFPRSSATAWKRIAASIGTAGSVYRSVRQGLIHTQEAEASPFQASFGRLDPALDSDPWGNLRGRIADICEAADVEVPAAQLSRIAEIDGASHSALELALDQVVAAEISRELAQAARGSADRVRVLRKWRAVLLLRQAGLATGNFTFRETVAAWLREQGIALNGLPGSALRVGLDNLILPRISITGGQIHILILPFRPRTYALNTLPPPDTVFAAIPYGDLRIAMEADGDRLLAHLSIVGTRDITRIADVVVDFSIAREGLLRAAGDMDGFTEIGYAAFARIERARAALVGRKRAESLPLYAVTSDGRLVRVEPNPARTPPLRAVAN